MKNKDKYNLTDLKFELCTGYTFGLFLEIWLNDEIIGKIWCLTKDVLPQRYSIWLESNETFIGLDNEK